MRSILPISLAALAMAGASPAAAQDHGGAAPAATRSAAFVGAQARLSFGSVKATRPVARLTAGMTHLGFDRQGALVHRPAGATFELGLTRAGRPDFFVGGQRYADVEARLGFAPAGVALLAVGGLAVVGVTVAAASGGEKKQQEAVCLGIGICPPLQPGG